MGLQFTPVIKKVLVGKRGDQGLPGITAEGFLVTTENLIEGSDVVVPRNTLIGKENIHIVLNDIVISSRNKVIGKVTELIGGTSGSSIKVVGFANFEGHSANASKLPDTFINANTWEANGITNLVFDSIADFNTFVTNHAAAQTDDALVGKYYAVKTGSIADNDYFFGKFVFSSSVPAPADSSNL